MPKKANELYRQQVISGEQLIVINAQLEIVHGHLRCLRADQEYAYSFFLQRVPEEVRYLFYVMTLPMGYVFGLGYLVVPMVVFIFFVLASLELIAEEIEDPFGKDANDLPTENYQRQYPQARTGDIVIAYFRPRSGDYGKHRITGKV